MRGSARTPLLAFLLASGCVLAGGSEPPGGQEGGSPSPEGTPAPVPAGFGTLRQEQITLSLESGELLVKVTPLEEDIIRLTAPDTYGRLAGLAQAHRGAITSQGLGATPSLFLVSFFTYGQGIRFRPEDLHLLNRGRRLQPAAIRPVTPGWGSRRLSQEEIQMAVYIFEDPLDLEQDLVVEYGGVENRGWRRVLQTIQAEEARARARARQRE